MSHHFLAPARSRAGACTLASIVLASVLVAAGCAVEPGDGGEHAVSSHESALTVSQRKTRSSQIKAAAATRGITNPLLIAGIAYHESGLAQCWSEATWTCAGPYSSECGGPVLTGAGDGPCSHQQGGIGMFQLDSGTYGQTLAQHGNGILDVGGNVAVGTDFIVDKVRYCPNTPSFASRQAVVDWINAARPGTASYESFMTAMAWCYNGCAPSYTSCSHNGVRNKYKGATEALLSDYGWDYWYTADAPPPPPPPPPPPVVAGGVGGPVASNADGRLEVFARGPDAALWHSFQDAPNGGFGGWSSLGGSLGSDPIAARNADGRLEVFARDAGGTLVQKWQSGSGGWSTGWLSASGISVAAGRSFAAASNADGRLEVFARTSSGDVVHRWQEAPNGGWSGWSGTGGFALDGPSLARNGDGRLEVFVRGGDGAIWHRWQNAPSSGWSDWSSLGGEALTAPVAAATGSGRLVVFVTTADHHLAFTAQNASGWTAWKKLGGPAVDGVPTVVANADGRAEVFARSGASIVHAWEWSPGALDFSAPEGLSGGGGGAAGAPAIGASIDGRLEVFTRATDGSIGHVWQLPSDSGGGWSGWASIGGSVPSF